MEDLTLENTDWEKVSNVNLLNYYLEDIQNGTLTGRPLKNLVHRGLLQYDRKDQQYHLTPKALVLLGR